MNQKTFKKQKIMSHSNEREQSVICFNPKEKEVESRPIFDINNLSFNNSKITIILDDKDEPWFYGNEIGNILGYSNSNKALTQHVKEKYVKSFNILKSYQNKRSFGLQGSTKFINEHGLYQLIMKSKLPLAEQFQDWIIEVVLPSIRKHGEYKLKKEIEDLTKKFKEQSLSFNNKNRSGYIYIGSTELEKSFNYFKIGKTSREVKERIKDYQIGRSYVNEFLLLDSFECSDCHLVERLIKRRLKDFHLRGEMFHIPYDDLKSIIKETIEDCECD